MNYSAAYRWRSYRRNSLHAERWTRDGVRCVALRAYHDGRRWWAQATVEWWAARDRIAFTVGDAVPARRRLQAMALAEALAARILRNDNNCPECGAEGRVA